MTTEKRKRFENVIRALMDKTVENGATEAEAMQAAAKAKELMDKYEIELTDAEILEEGAIRVEFTPRNMQEMTIINWMGMSLANFAEVKLYRHSAKYRSKIMPIRIIGLQSDAEFAKYLVESLINFAMAGSMKFYGRERLHFLRGFAARVSTRFSQLVAERNAGKMSNSRALAIIDVKKAAIDKFMLGSGLRLSTSRSAVVGGYGEAYTAGKAHGDKASFGRPIGGNGGPVALIGKR